jgi:hypothetical protein
MRIVGGDIDVAYEQHTTITFTRDSTNAGVKIFIKTCLNISEHMPTTDTLEISFKAFGPP